ncbi:hypothetical protein KKC97_03850 [bacterium]|nr:hypothetical protein [bacterium]MBU1636778.1 hypothetical protein [bacterium]
MPIFEYKCSECGTVIELLEKHCTHEKVQQCPVCDAERIFIKQFSTFAAAASGSASADLGPCGQPHGTCCGGGHCNH